ncbi:DUF4157 domain-containing protein [Streptomyces sp. NPDC006372]|uniref:DUF4157 domain-containing protein n=1 Tax=Streptomyces sp. NPDC006372 TaxID=3155599 RepID=UPI0033A01FDC
MTARASAAQARATGARPSSPAPRLASARTGQRPAACANHVALARDAHEARADTVADRVASGIRGADALRGLGRAPVGGFTVPSAGPGVPLDATLRRHLEADLGADLGAVRLHRDARSAAAVHASGAQAVAAGAHIHFATGRWAPHTPHGRRLLVHELAHVLQQTGVAAARHRLRATDRTGTGPAQATPRRDRAAIPGVPAPPQTDEIVRRHLAAHPSGSALHRAADGLRRDGIGRDAPADPAALTAFCDAFAAELRTTDPATRDADALALRVDLLKRGERWDAVNAVLDRLPTLRTAYYDARVHTELPEESGEEWVAGVWDADPLFEGFRAARFLEVFVLPLLAATRDVPVFTSGGRGGGPTLDQHAEQSRSQVSAPGGALLSPERAYAVLEALRRADALRLETLSRLAARRFGPAVRIARLGPVQRMLLAEDVARWADDLTHGRGSLAADESPETRAVLLRIASDLVQRAVAAVLLWRAALRLDRLLAEGAVDPDATLGGDPAVVLRQFGESKHSRRLRTPLTEALRAFFPLPGTDQEPEEPFPVAEQLRRAADLDRALIAASHTGAELPLLAEQSDVRLMVVLAWAQLRVSRLREVARGGPAEGAAATDPQALLMRRLRLASAVRELAGRLGWTDLVDLADAVLHARHTGETRSYLVLDGDWRPDPGRVTRLTDDFGDRPFGGLGGLNADQLVDLYLTFHYDDAVRALTSLRGSPPLATESTLLHDALAALGHADLPQRWVLDGSYAYVLNSDDTTTTPFELLQKHPRSQKAFGPHLDRLLLPDDARVFAWLLPPLDRVVDRLRPTVFSTLIATAIAPEDPDVPAARALPRQEWLAAYAALFTTADTAAAQAALAEQLGREREAALARFEAEARRVSTYERGVRTERELRPMLAAYDRHRQARRTGDLPGRPVVFDLPHRVLTRLNWLVGNLGPPADQPLHLAAAVLELADLLHEKFADAPRWDVVADYQPVVRQVLDLVSGDGAAALVPLLPGRGDTEAAVRAWILTRAGLLTALLDAFTAHQRAGQRRFGLEAVRDSDGQFLVGIGHANRIGLSDQFIIDGVTWEITEVATPFVYHPRYGDQPSVLERADGGAVTERVLLRVRRDGVALEVTRDRDDLLAALAHAVTMAGMARQLGEVAKLLEQFAETTMDLAEFVPGAGQAVMIARLVVTLLEFVSSPEFTELVESLFRDPGATLREWTDVLAGLLTPEKLWEYLLFGEQHFEQLRAERRPPPPKTPARAPRGLGQRAARLVRRLLAAGRIVLRALSRVQTRARWRMEYMELFVLGHPLLDRALRLVADHLDAVVALAGHGLHLAADWEEAVDGFADQVVSTALAVADFELPDEIIPTGELIGVLVELVVARLPLKFRTGTRTVLALLDLVGQRQAVYDAVASAIPEQLDPNVYWRREMRPALSGPLTAARDDLAAGIFDVLARFDLFAGRVDALRAKQGRLTDQGPVVIRSEDPAATAEAEEAEAKERDVAPAAPAPGDAAPGAAPLLRDDTAPAAARVPLRLPAETGRPLSTGLRRAYERGFGQDFRHVRVHTSPAAARAVGAVGASAVTSGSHVYFASGLAPAHGGAGGRVLAHELAHVVQQAGSRPLGLRAPAAPRTGTPGAGLVVDPRGEARAHGVAERWAAGATGGGLGRAAGPGTGRPGGPQPTLPLAVIRRLLDVATTTGDVERDAEHAARPDRPPPEQIRDLLPKKTFLSEFEKALPAMTCTGRLADAEVATVLRRHLHSKTGPQMAAVDRSFNDILRDSVTERRRPGPAAGTRGQAPPRVWELDRDRLKVALARVLFAETGVLLSVEFAAAVEGRPPQVASLTARYVHLPFVHGNSDLWKIALRGVLEGERHTRLRPRLTAHLAGLGTSDGVWQRGRFRINPAVVEEVERIVKVSRDPLTPAELPDKRDYLKSSGPGNDIGLRLATYGEQAPPGRERDSHHITQFLLLEYFTHRTANPATRPFPLLSTAPRAYPGLSPGANGPIEMKAANHKPMDLAGLAWERGWEMPTISLARVTHRTGRLHLSVRDGDEANLHAEAQSDVVHGFFRGALPLAYRTAEDAGPAAFAQYTARTPGGRAAVAGQIRGAMLTTYHEMRSRMEPRLGDALATVERGYFNDLARLKGVPDTGHITVDEMAKVKALAVRHAHTVMSQWGWD